MGARRRDRPGTAGGVPRLSALMSAVEGSFRYGGHRIAFADYGEGERTLVIIHGLLMNRHM